VPWFRTPLIVRREALHDAGIGEEGFPALFVERLELGQVLTDSGDLHLVAAHEAEGVLERAEMAEGIFLWQSSFQKSKTVPHSFDDAEWCFSNSGLRRRRLRKRSPQMGR
jgi:hypothetical protein